MKVDVVDSLQRNRNPSLDEHAGSVDDSIGCHHEVGRSPLEPSNTEPDQTDDEDDSDEQSSPRGGGTPDPPLRDNSQNCRCRGDAADGFGEVPPMRLQIDGHGLAVEQVLFRKRWIPERSGSTHISDDTRRRKSDRGSAIPSTRGEAYAYDVTVIADSAENADAPRRSSAVVRELTRDLDPDQKRAVMADAPLLAIIAGAGSGKTTVLTRRIARRCLEGTTDPMHTVVITFTRQAAAELKRRLRALGLRDTVVAGTFHAVCLSLLQQHWERTGRRAPTVVQDRRRLIGEVIGPRRTSVIDDLAAEIDWARARNIPARSYASAAAAQGRVSEAPAADVEKVMSDVEALKAKRGIIDLDDLISNVIDVARRDAEFADILRWRLRHLYVDEAQDMNPLQRAVLELWRFDRDDLTLVGDPSQAIYGFNGSDPGILLRLEEHFPGIEVVRLDTNYRCTPQIVRAGLSTLSHLGDVPPPLRSSRPDGPPVTVYGFADESAEASGVANLLANLRRPDEPWSDFAVLARTNAQLPAIRQSLEQAAIPSHVNSSRQSDPVQRIVREVGDLPSSTRIAAWSRDTSARIAQSVSNDLLDEDDEVADVAALSRVVRAVDDFLADGGGDGRSFLAWVRTHRPFDDVNGSNAVSLMTYHAAKGREWDTVVLVGCEDGLIPHSSAKSPAARAEEIRLAYVAETRAADRLVLTYSRSRKGRKRLRSPLIEGVDISDPSCAPTEEFIGSLRSRQSGRLQQDPVREELISWRAHAARVSGVDPRLICPDEVISELVSMLPANREELGNVPGLGAPLTARAGGAILDAIARGLTRRHVDA